MVSFLWERFFFSVSQRVSIYFNHCHSFKPTTTKFLKQHSFWICGLYDISLTDALNQTVSPLLHFLFATGSFSTERHNQPLILPEIKTFQRCPISAGWRWHFLFRQGRPIHPLSSAADCIFCFLSGIPITVGYWKLPTQLFTPPPPSHAPSN